MADKRLNGPELQYSGTGKQKTTLSGHLSHASERPIPERKWSIRWGAASALALAAR